MNNENNLVNNQDLDKYTKTMLILSKTEFDSIINSDAIKILTPNGFKKLHLELIKNICTNSNYFEHFEKLCENKIELFNVVNVEDNKINGNITLSKSDIVYGIDKLSKQNYFISNEFKNIEFKTFKNNISFDVLCEEYKSEFYKNNIDGINVSIPIIKMFEFLQSSREIYENYFSSQKNENYFSKTKKFFIYSILDFFKINKLFDNYIFPDYIIKRLCSINLMKKIDIEAINKITTTNSVEILLNELNETLKKNILMNIPTNFNSLEKAIYIYIKLCKTLTYDEEFFAFDQEILGTINHEAINNISHIDPINNKAVCYEFNAIYSKFLYELGINYTTNANFTLDFEGGHENLQFRYDKFIVNADSVEYILSGDLVNAKLNYPLYGLNCKNKNLETKEEFNNTLEKVYNIVAQQEENNIKFLKANSVVGSEETFDEIRNQYNNNIPKSNIELGLHDKFDLLIDKIKNTDFSEFDTMAYLKKLHKIIFTKDERHSHINMEILKSNENIKENKITSICTVFVINEDNIYENSENNKYYVFDIDKQLSELSNYELARKLDENLLEYINREDDFIIPGIKENKNIKTKILKI